MDTSKIIRGAVGGGRYTVTAPITQWDYGYIFVPEFEDLPAVYRLDFATDEHHGTALSVYCGAEGGEVPEELIDTGKDIFVWFFYVGDGFGKTEYKWRIPNKCKPKGGGETPEPSQQSSIDQLIYVANDAVDSAQESASQADASAQSASDDADRAESARDTAEGFASVASTNASESAQSAVNALTSARMAEDAKTSAQASAQSAQDALEEFTTPTASATTLSAGSNATASYSNGHFDFGIPRGADGRNGTDGTDGEDGQDGISPTVTITPITGGHRITITDADGEHSADVMDGIGNVDDVQINGTSIVENGVANVPVASADKLGAVAVKSSFGTAIGAGGAMYIMCAFSGQIKNGTEGYRPLNPQRQHESTFYGLAKAAGDTTQSQSSNAVGVYTEEAKIAIQKMLGLYKAPYRLIKTIEITEETGTITVVADDNGDAFALTDVIVFFEGMVATATSNGIVALNMDNTAVRPFITLQNLYNTSAQTRSATLSVDGGRFVGQSISSSYTNAYTPGNIQQNKNACGIIPHGIIDALYINSLNSHKFTSGTITIYGR